MLKDLTVKQETPPFDKWIRKVSEKLFNFDGDDCEPHKLNWQQKTTLKSLHENKYNIIKGFRCCGLTTMLMLNLIYDMLYKEKQINEYNALYIVNSKNAADCEMSALMRILNLCDEYIVLVSKNKAHGKVTLQFDNRHINVFFKSNGGLDGFRGTSIELDRIDVDNAAFIENKDVSDKIAMLSVQSKASVAIASTMNGENNLFYETWHDSVNGTAPFKMHSLKWYLDDRFNKGLKAGDGLRMYDIDNVGMLFEAFERHDMITNEWYEEKKALLGANVSREIDGDFL
jgi:hypothetical protein